MNKKWILSALIAPLSAGCTTPDVPETDPMGAVALGETIDLDGVSVTPLELIEDSRCPADTQCVWAGQLVVRTKIERNTNVQDRAITSDKPVSIGAGMLTLTGALPAPKSDQTIAAKDYRFTFTYAPHMMNEAHGS